MKMFETKKKKKKNPQFFSQLAANRDKSVLGIATFINLGYIKACLVRVFKYNFLFCNL